MTKPNIEGGSYEPFHFIPQMETRSIRAIFSKGERCHSRLPMEIPEEAGISTKIKWAKQHLDAEVKLRGEKNAVPFMRKFYPYYIKGIPNAAASRGKLMSATDYSVIVEELNKILDAAQAL